MFDAIYFDMDGTIADLYSVDEWEKKLRSQDSTPYSEAQPIVNMDELTKLCQEFTKLGITIGVISWLAMNSTKEYDAKVRQAKKEWLNKHFPIVQETHFVKYGTTKLKCAKLKKSVLVDDNKKVRNGWHGFSTVDANKNIIDILKKYLDIAKAA